MLSIAAIACHCLGCGGAGGRCRPRCRPGHLRPGRRPDQAATAASRDDGEAGGLDRGADLRVGAVAERLQRLADVDVVDEAAGAQRVLERDRALHVRAAVVDGAGDRQQLLVVLAGERVVLRLAGGEILEQQLGRHVAVADQQAVDVEHRRQQPLVVAGHHRDLREGVLDRRDLVVPALHVAHAVLGGGHALDGADLELGVEVVVGLGRGRVLEQDALEAGLGDRLVAGLRRALLVAEAQPAVVRVDQRGGGAGVVLLLRLLVGDAGALAGDAGDHRQRGRVLVDADQLELLVVGEEGALAGVAEDHQALHAVDRGEPLREAGVRLEVDVAVVLEEGHGGGVQALPVDCHCLVPSLEDRYRDRSCSCPTRCPRAIRIVVGNVPISTCESLCRQAAKCACVHG